MSAPFDELPGFMLEDVRLPVVTFSVQSSKRRTIHEYRWTPAGTLEVHGRSAYEFNINANFLATGTYASWPEGLARVQSLYEEERVLTLLWPTIGEVRVSFDSFKRLGDSNKRSGEEAELVFIEAETNRFLQSAFLERSYTIPEKAEAFEYEVEDLPDRPDLFDQIVAAGKVFRIINAQRDLYSGLAEQRLAILLELLKDASETVEIFSNPDNHNILDVMHELWDAAVAVVTNPIRARHQPRRHTVISLSTVTEVSTAIYGHTERARELIGLNYFDDPMRIPAGTSVLYVPEA